MTSAGLISVKDGVIHKLSPLSGHYRYVYLILPSNENALLTIILELLFGYVICTG